MFGPGERLVRRGDYIYGSFVRPERVDGYIVGVNPGDRSDELGRFAFSARSVDDAIGGARQAAPGWSRLPIADRSAALLKVATSIEDASESLATLIARETGKPLWEATEEVHFAARATRTILTEAEAALQSRVIKSGVSWSDARALGVVGVITPFVWPLLVPVMQVVTALVAGNAVVFKPSKFAPGTGQAVAACLDRCRLPRGVFNLVQGSGAAVGQHMASHPGFDALVFTGSFATAQQVRRTTADRPELPVLTQCGGKSAVIILDDADLARAAYDTVVSAWATAGQRQNSAARAFVHRRVFDAFCEAVAERAAGLRIGYAFDDDIFCGPMISDAGRGRFRRYVQERISAGATALLEGGPGTVEGRRGFYARPAMLWEHSGDALDEEPPGPVLQVYRVDDADEAVALHNRQGFRLSASVFTARTGAELRSITDRLDTGALQLNRGTIGASLRAAASGRGRSAAGIAGDVALMHHLVAPRATLVNRRRSEGGICVPGAGALPESGSVLSKTRELTEEVAPTEEISHPAVEPTKS